MFIRAIANATAAAQLLLAPRFHPHLSASPPPRSSTHVAACRSRSPLLLLRCRLACHCSTSTFSQRAAPDSSDGGENGQGFDQGEAYRILEDQCKSDVELREILGDCIVDPESMQKRVESRVKRKEHNLLQRKMGSPVPMAVSFRDFDSHDSFIWLELYDTPKEEDVEFLGSVFRSWYILGHLGSFNSLNIQLTRSPADQRPDYSSDHAAKALPCNFQNSGNLEFQHKWGRIWVDLGTSDPLSWDILINTLATVSSDHVGIKQLVFGRKIMGGWQENKTSAELKYKVYNF
ncbi:hypothetical protein O6H91_02G119300 [Diphasiastrum complanatum]|uniref:Uncharacterized protein n=1 Tax=Diphasiastrum complanatum TaxID=34168 RepID=A0ACC2EJT8_DIPCM|nr:hypothetical protein O6H91_02G119300 [Diphasiastrum complanatum]